MKKIKKSLLSVCLSISLMCGCLVPSISVYAVGDSWSSGQSYTYFENHFDDINTRLNGVIINQNQLRESFEDYLEEYRDNYNIPSGTTSSTWIGDNISGAYQNGSVGVSDLGFSQTFRQAMRDWCNTYIETNTGFVYGYSYPSGSFLSFFLDQTQYHAFLDFLSDHDSDLLFFNKNDTGTILIIDYDSLLMTNKYNTGVYSCDIYKNWQEVTMCTEYNYSNGSYVQNQNGQRVSSPRIRISDNVQYIENGYFSIVSLNTKVYQLYKSIGSMQNGTEGVQDYYITDSYNSTISGSYNTTTSNIENTIGFNNVNNYINNYYVDNGEYPTPTQINIYINQHINEGGGGSGGGDDDDDDNKPDWDFGFLGTIGEFLAELISGLGEIIGGILSALTSIITAFREGFPNVIGSLLEYFLPFLPEEIITLISLSILFSIILGIVKIIRG